MTKLDQANLVKTCLKYDQRFRTSKLEDKRTEEVVDLINMVQPSNDMVTLTAYDSHEKGRYMQKKGRADKSQNKNMTLEQFRKISRNFDLFANTQNS